MLITKSLYRDYRMFPKLAWLRANDQIRYQKATRTDSEDMREYIMELGKTVEVLVGQYLEARMGVSLYDAFSDIPEEDSGRLDDDDSWTREVSFADRMRANISHTREAIERGEPLIYQPGFELGDCYVRWDYLVQSDLGSYDLIEVKAKSSVRKEVTDDGEKRKIGKIADEFLYDVAFQRYVIDTVLASWWLPVLRDIMIGHVNSEYTRRGDIEIDRIITLEKIWEISEISVVQRKKSITLPIDDTLEGRENTLAYIDLMRSELALTEEAFAQIHPFSGSKYLEYFGQDKPADSIYMLPYSPSTSIVIKELHDTSILSLDAVPPDERSRITGRGAEFLSLYTRSETEPVIDKSALQSELTSLQYPICFYDYESISTPIPLLDGVSPYQQAVVQYSLHKLFEDGHIEHFWAVLVWEGDFMVVDVHDMHDQSFDIQTNRIVRASQEEFLDLMISDIGADIETASFVVWYKDFENTRNKEIGTKYPKLSDSFKKINERTYDLYVPFHDYRYFDRAFHGSASIKKVLPVLIPELSYDTLAIGKWDVAMNRLAELMWDKISDTHEREKIAKDLLIYCRQDSWAMVEIYRKLLSL